jgi:hypothetical protein
LHFYQPRQAPSLAGFFTSACGLGRPPRRLILAFLARFPLSFSTPCGHANGQVRKGNSLKINNLDTTLAMDVFSSIGRHLKNSERKNCVKSAQQAVFCPQDCREGES